MLRIIIIITIISGVFGFSNAQNISKIEPVQNGNKIDVFYKISGVKFYQTVDLSLFVSFDGGLTFKGPMLHVSGDTYLENAKGIKKLVWDVYQDVNSLEGKLVFDVRATIVDQLLSKNYFMQYSGDLMLSSLDYYSPFGITIGQKGKIGWFTTLRLNSFNRADYSFNGDKLNKEILYQYTSNTATPRFTVLAGALYQINWITHIYAGMGYAGKKYFQEIEEFSQDDASSLGEKWVEITSNSSTGFHIELGALIDINRINLSFSTYTYNFEHIGVALGVGYNFN